MYIPHNVTHHTRIVTHTPPFPNIHHTQLFYYVMPLNLFVSFIGPTVPYAFVLILLFVSVWRLPSSSAPLSSTALASVDAAKAENGQTQVKSPLSLEKVQAQIGNYHDSWIGSVYLGLVHEMPEQHAPDTTPSFGPARPSSSFTTFCDKIRESLSFWSCRALRRLPTAFWMLTILAICNGSLTFLCKLTPAPTGAHLQFLRFCMQTPPNTLPKTPARNSADLEMTATIVDNGASEQTALLYGGLWTIPWTTCLIPIGT